ncbi:MAG: lipocalin-like domain-containing protein [Gammaproteobacteria bacterium]
MAVLAGLLWSASSKPPPSASEAVSVVDLLGGDDDPGYQRALPGQRPGLPADHGPHPDFRSEWWYFTGNLSSETGRHFGFQLTFFRFALAPQPVARASAWATRQLWMAHLALTDTDGRRFFSRERLARGAQGLAGADAMPFQVWLEDWSARSLDQAFLPLRLAAGDADFGLELHLQPGREPVFQGDDGYSAKGPEPGNASLYYSYTRMPAAGTLRVGGERLAVTGLAWLDREWSTSALGPNLAGWDWFSIQLDDGSDLMFYALRRKDGSIDALSAGTLVEPDGRIVRLGRDTVELDPGERWHSPATGAAYPVRWTLTIPSLELELAVDPRLESQEMDLSVRYWEGAIQVRGNRDGKPVTGGGYLEMTGYDRPQ